MQTNIPALLTHPLSDRDKRIIEDATELEFKYPVATDWSIYKREN